MKQANLGLDLTTKRTRKREFLDEMNRVVPWSVLVELVASHAPVGYKGRTGVYELMVVDDALRALIHNRAAESELFTAAKAHGFVPMREDGERLVTAGITSLEEVLRVTRD